MRLRPYQQKAVDSVLLKLETQCSTLVVLPTGCGKTVVFAHVADHFAARGRVLVIAHREELIRQAADKIARVTGKSAEVEMADQWADKRTMWSQELSPFIVSSIQTQTAGMSGKGRMSRFNPMDFSLVIIDEAHHAPANSYRKMLAYYKQNPNLKVLGVTATPDRTDELAMGSVFDSVAYSYGIEDAVRDGWLAPIRQRIVQVQGLNFAAIKTTAGDLNQGQLAELMEREEMLHRIAHPTYELSRGRKTLVFCASVAQAEAIAEILNRHEPGCAEAVSGGTLGPTRERAIRRFKHGELRFLVNCGVFTEGYDEPTIEVISVARPTKSRSLYCQIVGRGTRPLDGVSDAHDTAEGRRSAIAGSAKPSVEVIDFTGNSGKHKLVSTLDILGGTYPPEVINAARKQLERDEEPTEDVPTMLARIQAEQLEREEQARLAREREAARRAKLVGTATYTTAEINPFDRFGVVPARVPHWHRERKPTEKQVAILTKNGVRDADKLNFVHAQQLVGELFKKWDQQKAERAAKRAINTGAQR